MEREMNNDARRTGGKVPSRSGVFRTHRPMEPLEPTVLVVGNASSIWCTKLPSLKQVAVRANDLHLRTLRDRNVIAALVITREYDDAIELMMKVRDAAQRTPIVFSCRDEIIPEHPFYGPKREMHARHPDTLEAEAPVLLQQFSSDARDAFACIDAFGARYGLTPKEADHLWQVRRGVVDEQIPKAQGVRYSTKHGRMKSIRLKTGLHRPIDMLAEALGLWSSGSIDGVENSKSKSMSSLAHARVRLEMHKPAAARDARRGRAAMGVSSPHAGGA
jgi:hypothetical protein